MRKAFFALLIPAMVMATGCTPQPTQTNAPAISQQSTSSSVTVTNTTMTPTSTTTTTTTTTQDPQLATPKATDTVAIMDTDFGTIKFKLFTTQVPELTKNFMELAKSGKYDNTPFHRVIQDFMIQGGDFTNHDGTGGYSYKGPGVDLPNEIDPALHHLFGTVSMAKTSAPVSIGSQFFIVTGKAGAAYLDGSYSPIGQVYAGMDVAVQIQNLQIPNSDKPSKTVNVKKVTITTYADDQKSNAKS